MADAVWQLTGAPGVCMGTLGPGMTNLVSPIAGAMLERSRVLALTAQCRAEILDIYTHQILDQVALLEPVVAWGGLLDTDCPGVAVAGALNALSQDRPAPVHLDVPGDAWGLEPGTLERSQPALPADLDKAQVEAAATAPVSASEEQLEDSEGHLEAEVVEANCDSERGCIDTFSLINLEILARMGWTVGDQLVPYLGAGLTVLSERLYIQYDDTNWSAFGLQPALHAGSAWTPSKPVFLSAGASVGLRQANQSPDGLGVFYRLEGAAAYRF